MRLGFDNTPVRHEGPFLREIEKGPITYVSGQTVTFAYGDSTLSLDSVAVSTQTVTFNHS